MSTLDEYGEAEALYPYADEPVDRTQSVRSLCLRCSYGIPHGHRTIAKEEPWPAGRNLGNAAPNRSSVQRLLDDWTDQGDGRRIDAIERRECQAPEPQDGTICRESLVDAAAA